MPTATAIDSTKSTSLTMSSREIANVTGKEHKNIIRDVRAMLNQLEIDGSKLSHLDSRGYVSEYRLPKDLTLTLVSGYNVKLRKKIIDRWLELEEGNYNPTRPTKPRRPSVLRTFRTAIEIGKLAGFESSQLAGYAGRYCEKKCGENPLKLMGAESQAAPRDEHTMTPRQIGKELGGVSAQIVNDKLLALGFQTYTLDGKGHRVYRLTEAGKPFGRLEDTSRAHTQGAVTVVRWYPNVVDALRTQPRTIPQLERAATREAV